MRGCTVWVGIWSSLLMIAAAPRLAAAPAALALSIGEHNVLDGGEGDTVGAEALFAPRRFHAMPSFVPAVAPVGGLLVAPRGIVYAYGGLRLDLPLGERWVATPGFAAGLFRPGDGQRLGGVLEFRSSIELAYRFSDGSRLGLCFSHLSNGGLYSSNPGSESLVLAWSALFRRWPPARWGEGPVLSSRAGGDTHGR